MRIGRIIVTGAVLAAVSLALSACAVFGIGEPSRTDIVNAVEADLTATGKFSQVDVEESTLTIGWDLAIFVEPSSQTFTPDQLDTILKVAATQIGKSRGLASVKVVAEDADGINFSAMSAADGTGLTGSLREDRNGIIMSREAVIGYANSH